MHTCTWILVHVFLSVSPQSMPMQSYPRKFVLTFLLSYLPHCERTTAFRASLNKLSVRISLKVLPPLIHIASNILGSPSVNLRSSILPSPSKVCSFLSFGCAFSLSLFPFVIVFLISFLFFSWSSSHLCSQQFPLCSSFA